MAAIGLDKLYYSKITEALYKGTKRNIESEEDPKNAVVG